MKYHPLFALLLFALPFTECDAFSLLEGVVRNEAGQPVERAVVLQSHSDTVVYTNEHGEFSIELTARVDYIKVLAPGYVPARIVVPYQYDEKMVVYLSPIEHSENFKAHEMVRRAQIKRPQNEELYTSYEATAYQQTWARLNSVPLNIWQVSGTLLPAKKDTGLVFWSERKARLTYYGRNDFDDSTTAFHAGGTLAVPDFFDLEDITLNFYEKTVQIKERRYREYYSPLFRRSLRLYQFSPAGTFYDEDRKVYRIAFEPKKPGVAAFTGMMEIYDSTWTLRSIRLRATSEQHLKLVDSINLEQFYFYHRGQYRKAYQELQYHLNLLGYSADYEVETYFDKFRYTSETEDLDNLIFHFDSTAVTDEEQHWNEVRKDEPSREEEILVQRQNLNAFFKEDYSSLTYLHNKFYPLKLFYRRYQRRDNNYYLNLSPLYYGLGYNTVEGPYFAYLLPLRIFEEQQDWLIRPGIRYGGTDQRLKTTLHTAYIYDLLEPKKLILEGGRDVRQFNEHEPILPIVNSFYSLFMARNYLKIFGKDYLMAGFDHEVTNGLEVNSRLEYAHRYPLYNTTYFHFTGDTDDFTPNNPHIPSKIDSSGFDPHRALTLRLNIIYQFGQHHKVVNGRKINVESYKPTIYINFRSGIPSGFSETNYSFLSAGISFLTRFGNPGYSQWDISGGGFLYNRDVPFIDYKHFNGEQTFFLQPAPDDLNNIKRFSTLRYYDYSTVRPFLETHFEHNFDGFLLSKMPFTRRLKIHSFTGFNHLYTHDDNQFLEFFIGFDNILSALRLEFAGTLFNFQEFRPLVRLGVDFDYLYYYQHTN